MGFLKSGKGLWQQIAFLIICCLILQKLFSITAFPAANNVWHLNGYFQILFNPYNPYNRIFLNSHDSKSWNLLLLPFFWMGLFLCLKDDRRFLWLPFFSISGPPFLQDQFRKPRLLFHAAPFFAMLSSRGLCVAGAIAASFLKNRKIIGDVASYLHIYPQAVESEKK